MCLWIAGLELDGPAEFMFGGGQVPVKPIGNIPEDGVSQSEVRVELKFALCRIASFGLGLERRQGIVRGLAEQEIRPGQSGVGKRVVRVLLSRFLKEPRAFE